MRIFLTFFLLASTVGWTQVIFTSPFSQNLTNQTSEWIDREIIFESDTLTIKTKTSEGGYDIQRLLIREQNVQEFQNMDKSTVFNCFSLDGEFHMFVTVPHQKKVEKIEVFIPNQQHHHPEHWRFLID